MSSFSCLCPLLLFSLAPFLFEDSLAFQCSEWVWKGLNSSRSTSFLCFSVILGACDTLVLCSWTTGFCHEYFLSGSRGRYRQQSGSISEGLEENFCTAKSHGLSVPIWPFLCDWMILFPWCPVVLEPAYIGFAACLVMTKALQVREWELCFCRNYLTPLVGEGEEKKQ